MGAQAAVFDHMFDHFRQGQRLAGGTQAFDQADEIPDRGARLAAQGSSGVVKAGIGLMRRRLQVLL